MKNRFWIPALLILLGGCARQEPDATSMPVPVAGAALDDSAWTRALLDHREEVDEEFRTSPSSPIAGAQRLTSESTDRVLLTRHDRTFALATAPDPAPEMALAREGTAWTLEALGPDVTCESEDEPVPTASSLEGPVACGTADLHLGVYPGPDSVTFIVYDPERSEKTAFEHLLYFPPDRSYEVSAELGRLEEPEEVEMLTSRGLKKTFYRYARIRFRLEGKAQELTAFKSTLAGEGSESLFIPFRDSTSGAETYGAGRYLDLEEPEGDRLVLDFNRAYNPLCNYSPAFNCPIPPRENRLGVVIRAGERTYPH